MATTQDQLYPGLPPSGQIEVSQDFRVTEFVNDLPKEVPVSIRELAWGFINRGWSLTFLAANEARAVRHLIDQMCIDIKRSVPAWKIDDKFIVELKNFQMYCYRQVFSATMRPGAGSAINERMAILKQINENISNPGKDSRRKSIFPWR